MPACLQCAYWRDSPRGEEKLILGRLFGYLFNIVNIIIATIMPNTIVSQSVSRLIVRSAATDLKGISR